MPEPFTGGLSRRERQIMETLYLLKRGAVSEVRGALPDPPSYSAVRTTMNILVRKGFLQITADGRRYLYSAVVPHEKARSTAVSHLLKTYFNGSVRDAVMGLINADDAGLDPAEHRELISMIRKARRREKKDGAK